MPDGRGLHVEAGKIVNYNWEWIIKTVRNLDFMLSTIVSY